MVKNSDARADKYEKVSHLSRHQDDKCPPSVPLDIGRCHAEEMYELWVFSSVQGTIEPIAARGRLFQEGVLLFYIAVLVFSPTGRWCVSIAFCGCRYAGVTPGRAQPAPKCALTRALPSARHRGRPGAALPQDRAIVCLQHLIALQLHGCHKCIGLQWPAFHSVNSRPTTCPGFTCTFTLTPYAMQWTTVLRLACRSFNTAVHNGRMSLQYRAIQVSYIGLRP